jgi:ATP-dependent RNA helicase SUPV3L1/SUV3
VTITALLGPTNTGKTHRAVEHMLTHRTGMIGLPLRLLAREIYDRITAQIGEREVALVTGEEKRVPANPRYWVCTVESMPVERAVDFLAVDEIQLAAHRQRGHTFTERLLHARGELETWFLGSDAMRPIIGELLPTAVVKGHPRFSKLSYIGALTLGALPPRTAVVAFSVADVYEIAERLRQRHGGTAVVLGALSPRTRNAQVAMYEAGEVQHMVATDAIGMGLNLDLDRVVFASLHKFDGKDVRRLDPAELAQIAGRAGRYTRDGGFGTLRPLPGLEQGQVYAIENNQFPAVRRVVWRNSDLDFSSLGALLESLRERPRRKVLRLVEQADDFEALQQLARMPAVRERATSPESVQLLWEVCRIPDFRKLLLDSHVTLLAKIYDQLSGPTSRLDEDWMGSRIKRLDDTEGDIDTLTNRIAFIRTWTYVTHHEAWVPRAAHWQEVTREIEDRQSDALHERLTERFVDRVSDGPTFASGKRRPVRRQASTVEPPADHPFRSLADLMLDLEEPTSGEPWIERVVQAQHGEIAIDDAGRLVHDERMLGRWRRGPDLLRPEVVVELEGEGAGAHAQVQRRLLAWTRDAVGELLAALDHVDERKLGGAGRGLLYQLRMGLGTVDRRAAGPQIAALSDDERAALEAAGIVIGRASIHAPSTLVPAAVRLRALLWSTHHGGPSPLAWPRAADVSLLVDDEIDRDYYPAVGFVIRGDRAVRADQLERVAADLHALAAVHDPFELPANVPGRLGCRRTHVTGVLRALGFRRLEGKRFTASG